MDVSELDHAKLQLENARLKLSLLETQMQMIQAQHQLVTQEAKKYETEVSVLESNGERKNFATSL